jgi:hypothetical protein
MARAEQQSRYEGDAVADEIRIDDPASREKQKDYDRCDLESTLRDSGTRRSCFGTS